MHEPGHGRGAAHVGLHLLHAVGRLQRDAAAVETDPLADEGDGSRLGVGPAVPADHRQLAFTDAAQAHAQQRAHAKLAHLGLAENLDLQAKLLEHLHAPRELFRVKHVCRFGNQVAGEHHAVGERR